MDEISEARLSVVCPELARRVRLMAEMAAAQHITIRVVQGLRTVAEQDALHAIGRSKSGKVVTNARGGYSYHNFGLAVDCAPDLLPDDHTFLPDWNVAHPTWQTMLAAGRAAGLTCGADWRTFPDYPHFQFTGLFPEGAPSAELRVIYGSGGLPAVWAALTRPAAAVAEALAAQKGGR